MAIQYKQHQFNERLRHMIYHIIYQKNYIIMFSLFLSESKLCFCDSVNRVVKLPNITLLVAAAATNLS